MNTLEELQATQRKEEAMNKSAPVIEAMEGMMPDSPAGYRIFRKEDQQAMCDVPWGLTATDPKYPFKVMGKQVTVPATECFNRPPFEGEGTTPPY